MLVTGSDLHLLHGALIELQKGDILGHECEQRLSVLSSNLTRSLTRVTPLSADMGIVESVGDKVTKVQPGDRVVASFNIACGNWSVGTLRKST